MGKDEGYVGRIMDMSSVENDPVKKQVRSYWGISSRYYDKNPGLCTGDEIGSWKNELSQAIGEGRKKILDVGTGTGIIAVMLAELGHSVTGVDFSREMLGVACQKTKRLGLEIDFREGDAENLPFADDAFDGVACRHLLWTLPNPEQAVREWVRVTRSGGRIVVIDGEWGKTFFRQRFSRAILQAYRLLRHGFKVGGGGYGRALNAGLPNHGGLNGEQIAAYLSASGVKVIRTQNLRYIRNIQNDHLPWLLKYSYYNPTYLVAGTVLK